MQTTTEQTLRAALEANGQRFTEQRAAVFRYLAATDVHPTAEQVLHAVREELPGISLATVYKSLETLVGCGLAHKLNFGDDSARYDGRTEPHHHARCLGCGRVLDVMGDVRHSDLEGLGGPVARFHVTGFRLELSGYCDPCASRGTADADAR